MIARFKKLTTAAALVLTACTVFAADTIKIGSVLSVTGPAGYLGDPELKTLQMMIEDINKKGGVLGRPPTPRPDASETTFSDISCIM